MNRTPIAAGAEPILLGTPGSAAHKREITRIDSVATLSMGVLSLVLVALVAIEGEHPPSYHPGVLMTMALLAIVFAAVINVQRMPVRAARSIYPLGVLATTIAVWAAGPTLAPFVAMFYMWFGGTIVHLPRRSAVILVALVGILYGAVVLLQDGNALPYVRWELVMTLTVTFAISTNRMVARSWALAESEREARADSERARAELQVVNDQKTEFLARMSHELRTPLNAVIGFSQVLAAEPFGQLTPKQAEYTDDIVQSGEHLLSLVDDLLDLSKVEAGALELSLTRIDLRHLLTGCVGLFQEETARRRVALSVTVASAATIVHADERKVRQIVLNLLSNAVKFVPDGGQVEISVTDAGDRVRIAVEDSGPGIAAADRDAIFEEFHQAKDTAPLGRGTGLGLPLARRFAELHGGHLWVDAGGTGARFVAELPKQALPPVISEAVPLPAEPVGIHAFGEANSRERREESARIAMIVGFGVGIAALSATLALMLFPAESRGARPGWLAMELLATLALVAAVALRPQVMASPHALMYAAAVVTCSLAASAYFLGPYWGPWAGSIYGWLVGAAILAFNRRWFFIMLVLCCISQTVAIASQPDAVFPVARWVVTIGFAVATAVIFNRLVMRIQTLSDADRVARTEAEYVTGQLLAASRHKTEFLTNMSHELRTPLNAVIGFSEVLDSEAFGPLNEKQREYVLDVHASGRHLLALINDILDLAKIEAGRMPLQPAAVDIGPLIETTTTGFDALATAKSVRLSVHLDHDLERVDVDTAKVREALGRLVSNTLKFTPAGGEVGVRAVRTKDGVRITVTDNGPGIDVDDYERIFEAFAHGGASTSSDQGSGLGLALARRYAQLHGGNLTVTSERGSGATFTLALPTSPADEFALR